MKRNEPVIHKRLYRELWTNRLGQRVAVTVCQIMLAIVTFALFVGGASFTFGR